ncbi:hypothetical protein K380107A5_08870 [Holdemania massiliensis]
MAGNKQGNTGNRFKNCYPRKVTKVTDFQRLLPLTVTAKKTYIKG